LVAVPSIGRASEVTPRRGAPEADATRDLYERYARQIHAYCLHQLGSREEAEDAVQSTFLNAFRGLKRGIDPEFESAWLYKIAENVCLTRQRSSFRRRRVETPGDIDAMQDVLPSHEPDSDALIRLPEALEEMPEQQRRAFLLREWQGLSYKEIAVELGLSQSAVETLLFRARRSLATALTEEPKARKQAVAKKLRTGGDAGSLVALLKTLIFSGGAKVAATVATVAATSVVAAAPAVRHSVEEVMAQSRVPHSTAHAVAVKARAPSAVRPSTILASSSATARERRAGTNVVSFAVAAAARRRALAARFAGSEKEARRLGHPPTAAADRAALVPAAATAVVVPPAPVPTVSDPAPAAPPAPVVADPAPAPAPAPAQPAPQPAPAPQVVSPAPPGPLKNGDGKTPKDTGGAKPAPAVATAAPAPVQATGRDARQVSKADEKAAKDAAKADAKGAKDNARNDRTASSATPPSAVAAPAAQPASSPAVTTTATPAPPAEVASGSTPGHRKNTPVPAPAQAAPAATVATPVAAPVTPPPAVTTPAAPPAAPTPPADNGSASGKSDHTDRNGHRK
jgi:RNA polymerase sigma factor (sigma-70 family)